MNEQQLPDDLPAGLRERFVRAGIAIALVAAGVMVGLWISPQTSAEAQQRLDQMHAELQRSRAQVAELNRALAYQKQQPTDITGSLSDTDRKRHQSHGEAYLAALRKQRAQPAVTLMRWFLRRWDELLDQPFPNDRRERRAELLSQLVSGMAKNIHPDDYVAWQIELYSGGWLGELHRDIDGDGLPGKRSAANVGDQFTGVSICQIAAALNQAVTDAQVLISHTLRCDEPSARLSVFLAGDTWNNALDEFVATLEERGFLVTDQNEHNTRLILIGPGTRQ